MTNDPDGQRTKADRMERVAKALSTKYVFVDKTSPIDGVVGVGIGDGYVAVYLLDESSGKSVPDHVDDIQIKKIVTGMPRLL